MNTGRRAGTPTISPVARATNSNAVPLTHPAMSQNETQSQPLRSAFNPLDNRSMNAIFLKDTDDIRRRIATSHSSRRPRMDMDPNDDRPKYVIVPFRKAHRMKGRPPNSASFLLQQLDNRRSGRIVPDGSCAPRPTADQLPRDRGVFSVGHDEGVRQQVRAV